VMRYHGNAKVLTVALSRKLRQEPEVLSALPNCALVAPSSAGIPVAFAIREALNADQILWLEKDKEKGERRFRQYFDTRGLKCILVDDLIRSGRTISEAVRVINDTGAQVIAVAALVRYRDAQLEIGDVPCHSLVEVDAKRYPPESWPADRADEPIQKVWF